MTDWPNREEVDAAVRDVFDGGRPELYPHWRDAGHVLEAEVRRLQDLVKFREGEIVKLVEADKDARETIRVMSENEGRLQAKIAKLEAELATTQVRDKQ